jgi:hypothetical protein
VRRAFIEHAKQGSKWDFGKMCFGGLRIGDNFGLVLNDFDFLQFERQRRRLKVIHISISFKNNDRKNEEKN